MVFVVAYSLQEAGRVSVKPDMSFYQIGPPANVSIHSRCVQRVSVVEGESAQCFLNITVSTKQLTQTRGSYR